MSTVDKISTNGSSLGVAIFWLLFHKTKCFLKIIWKEYSKLNAKGIF
jgi:hypothetical protein